jgi:methylated-DNA-[protein]-cysteine S-methyltransferase
LKCKFILFFNFVKLSDVFSFIFKKYMFVSYYDTKFGEATIRASEIGITELSFNKIHRKEPLNPNAHIDSCIAELKKYFAGTLVNFTTPVDFSGGPQFYKRVWEELLLIPYGETRSYLDLAIKLGDRNAVRAVGTANGKNPTAILVPCHRVIGTNGKLTGYAYGLAMKQQLLMLENAEVFGIQQSLFS